MDTGNLKSQSNLPADVHSNSEDAKEVVTILLQRSETERWFIFKTLFLSHDKKWRVRIWGFGDDSSESSEKLDSLPKTEGLTESEAVSFIKEAGRFDILRRYSLNR